VFQSSFLKVQLAKKYEEIMRSLDPGVFESEKLHEGMCKRMSGGHPNQKQRLLVRRRCGRSGKR
jgi:hypothetical protein